MLSALLALGASWCFAAAAVTEEDAVRDLAGDALWYGDFDELERQHALYQQDGQRTAAGRSKLRLFRDGLKQVLAGPRGVREGYFTQLEAVTRQWAASRPDSPLAHLLHAEALSHHGWWFRGRGFTNTVPPEAWRDFQRYVDNATDHLRANKDVVMRSSSGHVALLDLGRAAGWEFARLWPIAQAGLAINAEDEGLYASMLNAVLPRWGGNAGLVDRVIVELAQHSQPRHGDIFYARMYAWVADWEYQHRLFEESAASWPRIKAGYEQLLARHPAAVNTNAFARMACLARDKPTLRSLLARTGGEPAAEVWGDIPERNFQTCARWAAEP